MTGDELIDDNNLKINKRYCCLLHHENIFEGLFNCYLSAGQWILVYRKKGQNSPCNFKYFLIITFQLLMRKTLRHTQMYFHFTKRICSPVKLLIFIILSSVYFCDLSP